MTEQDLINLYNNCLSYQEEYKEAEANIKYPSKEELENKAQELQSQAMELLNKLEAAIQEAGLKIFNLSDYDLRALKSYYNTTKGYTKLKDINPLINTSSSFSFMKRNVDTYEFNKAMEILNK